MGSDVLTLMGTDTVRAIEEAVVIHPFTGHPFITLAKILPRPAPIDSSCSIPWPEADNVPEVIGYDACDRIWAWDRGSGEVALLPSFLDGSQVGPLWHAKDDAFAAAVRNALCLDDQD